MKAISMILVASVLAALHAVEAVDHSEGKLRGVGLSDREAGALPSYRGGSPRRRLSKSGDDDDDGSKGGSKGGDDDDGSKGGSKGDDDDDSSKGGSRD